MLEIEGFKSEQGRQKEAGAKRWEYLIYKDPLRIRKEIKNTLSNLKWDVLTGRFS